MPFTGLKMTITTKNAHIMYAAIFSGSPANTARSAIKARKSTDQKGLRICFIDVDSNISFFSEKLKSFTKSHNSF